MSALSINRRAFLLGTASIAAMSVAPAVPVAQPTTIGADMAVGADQMAWVIGTPGEYDWQPIFAATKEAAFREYLIREHGADAASLADAEENATYCLEENVGRVPEWDGRDLGGITSVDWFRAGLGSLCDDCGYETHPDTGGRIVCGEVFCEECMTFSRRIIGEPDSVIEDLANEIAWVGEDEQRQILISRGDWDYIPADMWAKACEEART